jgi:hypothetical protein
MPFRGRHAHAGTIVLNAPKQDYMLAATSFKYILDAGSMPFRGRHAHAGTNVLNAPKWDDILAPSSWIRVRYCSQGKKLSADFKKLQ